MTKEIPTILDKFYAIDFDEFALMLDKVGDDFGYDATPIGAKVFASMGVDGVHYCIMPRDGDPTLENSPVYRISPMDFDEGTIIWTAKNFHDFVSISIELKDFWELPCLIGKDEKEFWDEIESCKHEFEEQEEGQKAAILDSINILKKSFNPIEFKDIYQYVHASYSDKDNHVQLKFAVPDIAEVKTGFYDYTYNTHL